MLESRSIGNFREKYRAASAAQPKSLRRLGLDRAIYQPAAAVCCAADGDMACGAQRLGGFGGGRVGRVNFLVASRSSMLPWMSEWAQPERWVQPPCRSHHAASTSRRPLRRSRPRSRWQLVVMLSIDDLFGTERTASQRRRPTHFVRYRRPVQRRRSGSTRQGRQRFETVTPLRSRRRCEGAGLDWPRHRACVGEARCDECRRTVAGWCRRWCGGRSPPPPRGHGTASMTREGVVGPNGGCRGADGDGVAPGDGRRGGLARGYE